MKHRVDLALLEKILELDRAGRVPVVLSRRLVNSRLQIGTRTGLARVKLDVRSHLLRRQWTRVRSQQLGFEEIETRLHRRARLGFVEPRAFRHQTHQVSYFFALRGRRSVLSS